MTSEGRGPSVSLVSVQDGTDPGGWIIDLYAQFADEVLSRVFVGNVTISAVNAGTKRPTRLLAVASIPGAVEWFAVIRAPSPSPTTVLQFALFAGEIALTTAGLTPVDP